MFIVWGLDTPYKPSFVTVNPVSTCPTELGNQDLASRCSVGLQIPACALANIDNSWSYTKSVPLCYERNATTAAFRLVARRAYGIITDNQTMQFRSELLFLNLNIDQYFLFFHIDYDAIGEWRHVGCSRIFTNCSSSNAPLSSSPNSQAFLCAGCEITCSFGPPYLRGCVCSCLPFPDAAPYEPYCKK
jgi:hypothetical protein